MCLNSRQLYGMQLQGEPKLNVSPLDLMVNPQITISTAISHAHRTMQTQHPPLHSQTCTHPRTQTPGHPTPTVTKIKINLWLGIQGEKNFTSDNITKKRCADSLQLWSIGTSMVPSRFRTMSEHRHPHQAQLLLWTVLGRTWDTSQMRVQLHAIIFWGLL